MAATRLSLSSGKIRRETFASWCPTCGTKVNRDGRLGAYNRPGYCSAPCQAKYRAFNNARVLASTGGSSRISLVNIGPSLPAEVS